MHEQKKEKKRQKLFTRFYTTVPAFEAIRGHKSAYMYKSGFSFTLSLKNKQEDIWWTYAFFCYRASNSRALHFTLRVDNNTGVVLEVKEDTVSSAPCLALTDNDNWHG